MSIEKNLFATDEMDAGEYKRIARGLLFLRYISKACVWRSELIVGEGRPVSLILDYPLVYSDDARLGVMIDILREAAPRMKVILPTCRDRAFRHVSGHRISFGLSPA